MEPNHNSYQPSAELPQPQAEAGVPSGQGTGAPHEVAPAAPERASQPMTPVGQQPMQPVSAQPTPAMPAPGAMPSAPATATTATNGLIADDIDLIEKEWVVKAKAIVAQTKDDPYQQNKAMSQVKADYLKKRYNKDLKVNNEG